MDEIILIRELRSFIERKTAVVIHTKHLSSLTVQIVEFDLGHVKCEFPEDDKRLSAVIATEDIVGFVDLNKNFDEFVNEIRAKQKAAEAERRKRIEDAAKNDKGKPELSVVK